MVNPISVNPVATRGTDNLLTKGLGAPESTGSASFRDLLEKSLGEVNNLQSVAEEKISKFATGEVTDLKDVMVAVEDANLAFQFTLQIRNKIVEAYQEISRLQV
ncbi:MAG: flagellar hook-basal body complex protein FliE [Candidatus Omnitrophica bacterium]|jgi:flagellar hook-basal body complex protein FliE|nr:flagellar hook-basal body complex protein FliE [bacterium]MBK7496731.1 flagellar hook-basal body complex protein FliE [Candidatus Omnitrophota bacterium]MCE7909031.1 flagellar hook-basal body complex protein FliE [Candidatus Omnitrophica bacterium COP1]MBV6481047.1 Flagellar hook-basal body complex protein FliE [bacterium]MBW7937446.1 flagellar hook-basal body complex protein FliE [Candidatus Omnitrophota bacterium]